MNQADCWSEDTYANCRSVMTEHNGIASLTEVMLSDTAPGGEGGTDQVILGTHHHNERAI